MITCESICPTVGSVDATETIVSDEDTAVHPVAFCSWMAICGHEFSSAGIWEGPTNILIWDGFDPTGVVEIVSC